MRVFYITLNTSDEARDIARALLERRYAVCCNWFPITCAYRWEGRILEEAEVVLLVKTRAGYRDQIEALVRDFVSYTNCVFELAPDFVNARFQSWLEAEVPAAPHSPPNTTAVAEYDWFWD